MATGKQGQASGDHAKIAALVDWTKNKKNGGSGGAGIVLRSGCMNQDPLALANLSTITEFAVAWQPRRMRTSLAAFRTRRQTGCPVLAGRL